MTPTVFTLTPNEKASPLWARLAEHCTQRLASLRAQNDGVLDEAKTALLRGRIAEIKAFLALADELPIIGT